MLASILQSYRQHKARERFLAMTRHFDEAIERARKDHSRVKAIQAAKQAFVHQALAGGRK